MAEDKILKLEISKILDKYGFKLANVDLSIVSKEKFMQDMMNNKLDTILDSIVNSRNCINEIMRIIYNVKELSEVVKVT